MSRTNIFAFLDVQVLKNIEHLGSSWGDSEPRKEHENRWDTRLDLRLEHASGTYVRDTRQGHTPGTYVWNIRLEHMSGTYVKDIRLGRTSGTYVRL